MRKLDQSNTGKNFMENLIEKKKTTDEHFEKLSDTTAAQNLMFVDIETGAGFNQKVKDLRIKKIRSKYADEIYTGAPSNWKDPTKIRQHRESWDESQRNKLNKEVSELNTFDALNPLYHRIVIMCYEVNGKTKQMTELEVTEKEMIEEFARDCQGKTIVTFNGYNFDIFSIQLRAIQYEIPLMLSYHIDLYNKIKRWNTYTRQYTSASQDMLAAIFGIEPNKYASEVNPGEIGDIFQNAKNGITPESKSQVETVLKYSLDDVRILKELYFKMKVGGLT